LKHDQTEINSSTGVQHQHGSTHQAAPNGNKEHPTEINMTKLHDSHQAAPPGSKVQTTQAPTSTMHHGTTLHAKAHKAIRQGCKLTMTMTIVWKQ